MHITFKLTLLHDNGLRIVTKHICMYMLIILTSIMHISAKKKQDIFWKINIAAYVLYYISQVLEFILLSFKRTK